MSNVLVARKNVSASLVVMFLLTISITISTVRADITIVVVSREHFGAARSLGDSVPAYATLKGVHVWEMWIHNDQSNSEWIVDPHITITSPIGSLSFRPLPSMSTNGSDTIYDWSFQSISPGETCYVDGGGYPPYTYSPMFDSSRTVSSPVIYSASALQNLTVRVTPHFASDWVWVRVVPIRSRVATATFISAIPDFNDTGTWSGGTPWAEWKLKSYPEKEYVLTCALRVTNKAYPKTVNYKPRVSVGCWGVDQTSQVESSIGSSITVQDKTLGSIRYSASGSYLWRYLAQEGTLVDYQGVSR